MLALTLTVSGHGRRPGLGPPTGAGSAGPARLPDRTRAQGHGSTAKWGSGHWLTEGQRPGGQPPASSPRGTARPGPHDADSAVGWAGLPHRPRHRSDSSGVPRAGTESRGTGPGSALPGAEGHEGPEGHADWGASGPVTHRGGGRSEGSNWGQRGPQKPGTQEGEELGTQGGRGSPGPEPWTPTQPGGAWSSCRIQARGGGLGSGIRSQGLRPCCCQRSCSLGGPRSPHAERYQGRDSTASARSPSRPLAAARAPAQHSSPRPGDR